MPAKAGVMLKSPLPEPVRVRMSNGRALMFLSKTPPGVRLSISCKFHRGFTHKLQSVETQLRLFLSLLWVLHIVFLFCNLNPRSFLPRERYLNRISVS